VPGCQHLGAQRLLGGVGAVPGVDAFGAAEDQLLGGGEQQFDLADRAPEAFGAGDGVAEVAGDAFVREATPATWPAYSTPPAPVSARPCSPPSAARARTDSPSAPICPPYLRSG
jgi:hypothetical protein